MHPAHAPERHRRREEWPATPRSGRSSGSFGGCRRPRDRSRWCGSRECPMRTGEPAVRTVTIASSSSFSPSTTCPDLIERGLRRSGPKPSGRAGRAAAEILYPAGCVHAPPRRPPGLETRFTSVTCSRYPCTGQSGDAVQQTPARRSSPYPAARHARQMEDPGVAARAASTGRVGQKASHATAFSRRLSSIRPSHHTVSAYAARSSAVSRSAATASNCDAAVAQSCAE